MFTPLADRLGQLPLVLAGPILRHVGPQEVTVWIALQEARSVTLTVTEETSGASKQVMAGSRQTVAIGDNLHVVAVTALPLPGQLAGDALAPEVVYYYDLQFDAGETLLEPGVVASSSTAAGAALSYDAVKLPSFSLPPHDLYKVRLVHGSCRKPSGPNVDTLALVDRFIQIANNQPSTFALDRPHQLFLTGDQIYADDVADSLLDMLVDAGETLLGWKEVLPATASAVGGKVHPTDPNDTELFLPSGARQTFVEQRLKFTSSDAKSHLLGLGEFYAMYLFAWAPTLWPDDTADLPRRPSGAARYVTEIKRLVTFHPELPRVRRALANVPTYMIFDDHEVTDDWFIDRRWCRQIPNLDVSTRMRVLQNALLAYAIFQAWGNTPEQFAATGAGGLPGRELLQAAESWNAIKADASQPGGKTIEEKILDRLGLKLPEHALGATDTELPKIAGALRWHYRIDVAASGYEVIFLDCRTKRSYRSEEPDTLGAALLSDVAFDEQMGTSAAPQTVSVTIVVSQGPVFLQPTLEAIQADASKFFLEDLRRRLSFMADVESWGLNQHAFNVLLARLAKRNKRVIVLSGDVHWGFAAVADYHATKPYKLAAQTLTSRIVQLTSSGLRNMTEAGPVNVSGVLHRTHNFLVGATGPKHAAGWSASDTGVTVSTDPGELAQWVAASYLPFEALKATPPILHLPPPKGTTFSKPEEWRVRIEWLEGKRPDEPIVRIDTVPNNFISFVAIHPQIGTWLANQVGRGMVGEPNIAELSFQLVGTQPSVVQQLHWSDDPTSPAQTTTTWQIPLDPPAALSWPPAPLYP
jgi:hypothetical protein